MAITARGAWVAVQRHFRERGVDVQQDPVSVIGIGDMSGDVFGNGMLCSRSIRLVAAFDHRHIFIDPDPDPSAACAERERLFALPRSSWADYDPALISRGGGVFARNVKSIALGAEMRRLLATDAERLTPAELISVLLAAPVDLIFNGGIGTWFKASDEDHASVGDKANDGVRIDATRIRARVIGEGGNLGLTQRARVEFAAAGGACNTDFIDNSAGVDCSDHEVNIKILLRAVLDNGDMTLKQRDDLLATMTDEVGSLVLRDNVLQNLALSVTEQLGLDLLDAQIRLMRKLERQGRLDRQIEFLPRDNELAERRKDGRGLTRPEAAVLLAYAKMTLYEDLLRTELPDRTYLAKDVAKYFPRPLRRRFMPQIEQHLDAALALAVVPSSGLYIGGEETAVIATVEGSFPFPRRKPPFPAQCGVHGAPTIVNNVETLAHVPGILRFGAAWYRGLGLGGAAGTKLYSLSGDVLRPGLYELPMGTPLHELVFEHGGGMLQGKQFKAVFTGGPSNTLLTRRDLDVPLDFDAVRARGSRLGTGAMIVVSEGTSIVRKVAEYLNFFAQGSCGQCPPCKGGSFQLTRLLNRIDTGRGVRADLDAIENLCRLLPGSGRCGLIDGAVTVVQSSLRQFRDEYEALLMA